MSNHTGQITEFTQTSIANLYIAILGRNPEPEGFAFWCDRLADNGNTQDAINDIARGFADSREFTSTYGNKTTEQAITLMYVNVLDRQPDGEGLAYWTDYANSLIASGYRAKDAYALTGNAIITTAANNNSTDTPLIVAKQAAAIASGTAAPTETYTLTTGIDNIQGAPGDDIFDASLGTLGNAAVNTLQAFDSIDGGTGYNSLQAVLNASVRPLALDNIQQVAASAMTGAVTLDLLNAPDLETVVNVQSSTALTFTNLSAGATDLVVSDPDAGVDTVFTYASTAGVQNVDLEVDGLETGGGTPSASEVTIDGIETINVTTANVASVFTLNANAATTVNIAGDVDLNLSGASVATAINAAGFNGNLTATLGVSGTLTGGNGNDSLTGVANAASTIIGGEGDDSITAGAASTAHNDNMSGGAGNDTFTFAAGLTVDDTIDGGTGTEDTLVTTSAQAIAIDNTTPTTYNITNIEELTITDQLDVTTTPLVLTNIATGINTLNLSYASSDTTSGVASLTDGAETVNGGAGSLTVNLGGNVASNLSVLGGQLTITDTGSATTDILTLNNLATAGTANIDVFAGESVTSTGYETVNINTGAGTNVSDNQDIATLTITADSASANTALNLSGTNAIDFNTGIASNTTGVLSINASALTAQASGSTLKVIAITSLGEGGTVSITGSAGNDVIGDNGSGTSQSIGNVITVFDGGAGADRIETGSAADSLVGGIGNDTIVSGTGNDTVRGGEGADTLTTSTGDVLVDGGEGADVITVSTGSATVDGGAGNDSISVGSTLSAGDQINGGEGIDTLAVAAAITSPSIGAVVTNIETLSITETTAAVSQDLSMFANTTITSLISATTNDVTVSNAGSTFTTLELTDAGPKDVTVTRTTAADALTTALTVSMTKGADTTVTSLTANDEVTLTLNTAASTATVLTTLNAAELQTLNITGSSNVTVTNKIAGSTTVSTISNQLTGSAALSLSALDNTAAIVFTAGTSTGTTTLTTGSGADSITAGAGALSVSAGSGNDTILGGSGADTIVAGAGNDSVIGGAGNDTITGDVGADYIDGGSGVDTFSAEGMSGVTDGGLVTTSGAVINLSASALIASDITTATNLYTANNGAGNINILSGQAAYLGTTGNDLSSVVDTLVNIENVIGSAGSDYIVTSNNSTTVAGGSGADTITGGTGNDSLSGEVGADSITAGAGNDTITGGADNDSITLGTGSDTLVFADTAANNGMDTIATFTAGAVASGGDVFNFAATSAASVANSAASGIYTAIAASATTPVLVDNKLAIVKGTLASYDTAAEIAGIFGAAKALNLAGASQTIVVVGADGGTSALVWYVDTADATVADSEVVLVGTVTTSTDLIDSLVAANFVF